MAIKTGNQKFMGGAFGVEVQAPSGLSGDVQFILPSAVPASQRLVTINSSGQLATNPDQSGNKVLASPAGGGSGAEVWRALVWADVSGLAGTSGTSFCAGNDARLHSQNTDTGTTATSYQIDSGNAGPRAKNVSGAVHLRNAADNAYVDLRAKDAIVENLTVNGSLTTKSANEVEIGDAIIVLNQEEAGTPTVDAGIEIERGTADNAQLLWDETDDEWKAGIAGSLERLLRESDLDGLAKAPVRGTFVAGDLSSGVLTITHNLDARPVKVSIFDASYREVIPDDAGSTTVNAATADLSSFDLAAETWHYLVVG